MRRISGVNSPQERRRKSSGVKPGQLLSSFEEANMRALEAWRLRATEGLLQAEIARRMGVSHQQVQLYLDRARQLVPEEHKQRLDTYFEEALSQLDNLLHSLAPRIKPDDNGRIDMEAVKEYRKTVESKRRLLGLDRDKQRIELTGEDGGAVKIEAVSDEIVQLAQKRKKVREIEVSADEVM